MLESLPFIVIVLGLLWLMDRKDRHIRGLITRMGSDAQEHRDQIARLSEQHRAQLAEVFSAHRAEVAQLCQRIQAPEAAVIQHHQETAGSGEAIYPMTDEESAEQQEQRQLAIARIEQIENEGIFKGVVS